MELYLIHAVPGSKALLHHLRPVSHCRAPGLWWSGSSERPAAAQPAWSPPAALGRPGRQQQRPQGAAAECLCAPVVSTPQTIGYHSSQQRHVQTAITEYPKYLVPCGAGETCTQPLAFSCKGTVCLDAGVASPALPVRLALHPHPLCSSARIAVAVPPHPQQLRAVLSPQAVSIGAA
jgi:hypothetical protein